MGTVLNFKKKFYAAFIAAALVAAILAGITWKVLRDADDAAKRVAHTNEVLKDLSIAREATFEIESITRGYIILGDKEELKERAVVAQRRAKALDRLQELTADNPSQQQRMESMRVAAQERSALSAYTTSLRETKGFEAARDFSATAPVIQTRDRYLRVLTDMYDEEQRLLNLRNAQQQSARDIAVALGLLTALTMLTLLIATFILITRQMRETSVAQHALEEVNHTLEQAKDEADHANAAKDTFLATMSHEIRTPMTGLMGMLELLAHSKLDGEQSETLAVARDSGHALRRIIDDILDHAKIKAGKLKISPEPVSLVHLLGRIVSTYQAVASSKGLTLVHTVDPRIGAALLADPLRLQQVLANFVSNAIKFTREGHVRLQADFLGQSAGAETVMLSVQDTGIGMTPEVQARIFQPFEQAAMDTARMYGGTGLGLAISRRLAEMMGSNIAVESTPGVGTTISLTLTLPVTQAIFVVDAQEPDSDFAGWQLTKPPLATANAAPQPATLTAVSRVLAVDDNATNRMLIARQLKMLGMQVQTAEGGEQALAMWKSGDFALIVTDINMPQMDGYALTRAIRQAEAAQGHTRIPVLAWTANALPVSLAKCHAAGMDDVLTKPAELAQLRALLEQWLPAASTTPPPAIDLSLLLEVAGDDQAVMQELVHAFRDELRTQTPQINSVVQGGDLKAIQQASHKMKGCAANIGARSLQNVCARMEAAASGGDAAAIAGLMPQLSVEAQRVLDALAAHN
jgi:signal transduction histidine kinase/DNA-binding response OmpR family regulator